jgi:hypothetical protein
MISQLSVGSTRFDNLERHSVNTDVEEYEARRRRERERRSEQLRQHRHSVEEVAKRIRFD